MRACTVVALPTEEEAMGGVEVMVLKAEAEEEWAVEALEEMEVMVKMVEGSR